MSNPPLDDATRQRLQPNDNTQNLLEKISKSNPHLRSYDEKAFMYGVENGNEFTVQEFLDKGVNPNLTNVEGKIALIIAAEKDYTDITKMLLQKMDTKLADGHVLEAAISAIENNNYKALEGLLNTGILAKKECWNNFEILNKNLRTTAIQSFLIYGYGIAKKGAISDAGLHKLMNSYHPQVQTADRSKFSTMGWWWNKFMGIFYGGTDRYIMKCFIDASKKNDVKNMQFYAETLGFNINEINKNTLMQHNGAYPPRGDYDESSTQSIKEELNYRPVIKVEEKIPTTFNNQKQEHKLLGEQNLESSFKLK